MSNPLPSHTVRTWCWIRWFSLIAISIVIGWSMIDDRSIYLLVNTAKLSLSTALLCVPIGLLVAWLLERTDVSFRHPIRYVLIMMLFFPLYLYAAGWDAGFGVQGWLNTTSNGPRTSPWLTGWRGAIWVHATALLSWVILMAIASLRSMSNESELAARLDASLWTTFWKLGVPQLVTSAVVCSLWVVLATAGEITVTDLFQIRTYAEEVYIGFALEANTTGSVILPAASSVGTSMVLSLLLGLVALFLLQRFFPDRPLEFNQTRILFPLGPLARPVGLVLFLIVLLLALVPIGNLLYKSGTSVQQIDGVWTRQWTVVKCLQLVLESPWRYRREYGWSLAIGFCAATAAVIVGWIVANAASRGGWRLWISMLALALLLAIPGPVLGIGLIGCLNQPTIPGLIFIYDRTIFAPVLAATLRSLPIVALTLWHGVSSLPDSIIEAAILDGADRWQRWRFVTIPQCWPVIVCAWLIAMALSLAELSASILVVPPGVTTLSIRIFNLIHYGVEDRLAGLCLFTILLFVILIWLAEQMWNQLERGKNQTR